MDKSTCEERVLLGIKRFLVNNHGFKMIEEQSNGFGKIDFVCQDADDGSIHFIIPTMTDNGSDEFDTDNIDIDDDFRKYCESVMIKFFKSHNDWNDCSISFDICNMLVIGDDRAIIRFHRSV